MRAAASPNLYDPTAPHNRAMSKAKIQLMASKDSVFFATLCFSLKHLWDETIPTACTDGIEIKYSPKFFMDLTQPEQVFLLLHESMHVAYMHAIRSGSGKNPKRWNWACDYVINLQLVERGYTMPKGGLLDTKFKGMSAEQVYQLIPEPPEMGGAGFAPDDLAPPSQGQQGPDSQGQGGDKDSGAGNGPKAPGMSPEEIQRKVEDILVRAQLQSKMSGDKPGTVPGDVEIFLKNLLDPKLPWNRILAKYLNKYSKNDYSWKKPSRRFFPTHYMPSLHSQALMDITFAIDTSGSVSDSDFKRMISEISGVLKMMKPEKLRLLQFDTSIKSVDDIRNVQDLHRVRFSGRGGTDISPVIKWATENKPQVLLILTDGEFHVPNFECKSDLIWLIHNNKNFTYPQGKIIHYEID